MREYLAARKYLRLQYPTIYPDDTCTHIVALAHLYINLIQPTTMDLCFHLAIHPIVLIGGK